MDRTAKHLTRGILSLIEEVNRKLGRRFEVLFVNGAPSKRSEATHVWLTVNDSQANKQIAISYTGFPETSLSRKERNEYAKLAFCERSYRTLGLSSIEVAQLS